MKYIIILLVLIVLAVVAVSIKGMRGRQRSSDSNKVVSIKSHAQKKPAAGAQKCSYCKQPAKQLTFYAEHNGTVVGLCTNCKKIAERKDMLPI